MESKSKYNFWVVTESPGEVLKASGASITQSKSFTTTFFMKSANKIIAPIIIRGVTDGNRLDINISINGESACGYSTTIKE